MSIINAFTLNKRINSRGDVVYQCDVCTRKIRVPANRYGIDVVSRCIVTKNCNGKLHKVLTLKEKLDFVPAAPASSTTEDWIQRRVFYHHTQPIESSSWIIAHDLANNPSVQTFVYKLVDSVETLVEQFPTSVRVLDDDTVEVTFDRAYKGVAHCIATASANNINPPEELTVSSSTSVILTNDGEITIATENSDPEITLTVRYQIADNVFDITYADIDTSPSVLSPWVGASRVFIGGRLYNVRSFNLIHHPSAAADFSTYVSTGAQVSFPSLSTLPNKNFILMGNSPFSTVDRIWDKVIDISAISTTQPELVYQAGEVSTADTIIKNVYPPVHVVD